MPQEPSREKAKKDETEKSPDNDQAKHRYYYDDAHGYQDFDPEEECDEDGNEYRDGEELSD